MSNFGQVALSIVGAVVGYVIGGPTGALYGAEAGLLAGTLIFPSRTNTSGPRITDLATTAAVLGGPVARTWGTIVVPGTVIWLDQVVTTTSQQSVSKNQSVTNYNYTQSIAIGLCEKFPADPQAIDGVLRIWENGQLVYDVRPQQTALEQGATNFLGTWNAADNLPPLESGQGNEGDWYTVAVAGSTLLNGVNTWAVGETVWFDGTQWRTGENGDDYQSRLTANATYEQTFTLYLGSATQDPDPTIEAIEGATNTPAFRDLAYIVYPNRTLTEVQALRHPNFQFEVFHHAEAPPFTLYPTALPGAAYTAYQVDKLAVSWARGIYYTLDLTTGTGAVRVFAVQGNVELAQFPLPALLGGMLANFVNGICTDDAGNLYISYAVSGLVFGLARCTWDGAGLTVAASATGGDDSWPWHHGVICQGVFSNYLLELSVFFDLAVYSATSCAQVEEQATGDAAGAVCAGAVNFGWGLTLTPAANGIGTAASIWRMQITQLSASETVGLGFFNAVTPASIDPTWTRFSGMGPLLHDVRDGNLLCILVGGAAGGGPDATYLVKLSTETGFVLWTLLLPNGTLWTATNYPGMDRVINSTLIIPSGTQLQAYQVDTQAGTLEAVTYSASATVQGVWTYDAASNMAISFTTFAGWTEFSFGTPVPGDVTLAQIVHDTCALVNLTQLDVTDLEDITVHGYALNRVLTAADALTPLRSVGQFDVVESSPVLRFPTRGKQTVATITLDDLGVHDDSQAQSGSQAPAITTTQTQDVALPRQVRVTYLAPSRDYNPGTQLSPVAVDSESVNIEDVDLAVAIGDDQAAQIAEILWSTARSGNYSHAFPLDRSYLYLEPADCINLPVDGTLYRVRIVDVSDAGGAIRTVNAVRDDADAYVSSASASSIVGFSQRLQALSPSALIAIDAPALRDQDSDPGVYVAVRRRLASQAWGGALVQTSSDGGATWQTVGTLPLEACTGTVVSAIPAGATTIFDNENTLTVDVASGAFTSRSFDDVIGGANVLAVGAPGRWEIMQFMNAAPASATRVVLSGLLRGRRGTEWAMGASRAGDAVVLMSGNGVMRAPLSLTDIGKLNRLFRAATVGLDTSSATPVAIVPVGMALRPFSGVAALETKLMSGDIQFDWTRRGRLGQELPSGADIPLSEETEAYEIDILGGSPDAPVRTLKVSSPTATYALADQTTDFGMGVNSVPARLYQISAAVGRGTETDIEGAAFAGAPDIVTGDPGTPAGPPSPPPPDGSGNQPGGGGGSGGTTGGGGGGGGNSGGTGSSVKFNPGVYADSIPIYYPNGNSLGGGPAQRRGVEIPVLRAGPTRILGLECYYGWTQFENDVQGQYDFSAIDDDWKALTGWDGVQVNFPRRMAIYVEHSDYFANGTVGRVVPAYVQAGAQFGSSPIGGSHGWTFTTGQHGADGSVIAFWRPAVMNPYIAMWRAMAAHRLPNGNTIDEDPNIEWVKLFSESADIPISGSNGGHDADASWTDDGMVAQFGALFAACRAAFPHTILVATTNYSFSNVNAQMEVQLCNLMRTYQISQGGPDTFGYSSGQNVPNGGGGLKGLTCGDAAFIGLLPPANNQPFTTSWPGGGQDLRRVTGRVSTIQLTETVAEFGAYYTPADNCRQAAFLESTHIAGAMTFGYPIPVAAPDPRNVTANWWGNAIDQAHWDAGGDTAGGMLTALMNATINTEKPAALP